MSIENPTFRHYAALATSVVLNSATLVLLKTVAVRGIGETTRTSLAMVVAIAIDPLFVVAVVSFLAGIYFWIVALKRIDLSLAYPSVSVSYVLIAVVSRRLFGEEIGVLRWVGIAVIMLGVAVMYLPLGSASRTEER